MSSNNSNVHNFIFYKEVEGFPDYLVGSDGSVWSKKVKGSRNRSVGEWWPMKLKTTANGYYCVNLYRQHGKQERRHVHRIVLESFVGPKPEGTECLHKDGNKKNNNLNNLRWGSRSENVQDAIRHGDLPVAEKSPKARLTNMHVLEIRRLASLKIPYKVIGQQFGIGHHYVARIACREIWKHI